MNNNLFIKRILLNKDGISDFNIYPFNIDIVRDFESVELNAPVTFLVGENGVGKSTFIEALAINSGMNAEGGSNNFGFKTKDTHSILSNYLILHTNGIVPKTKFFLRAESFYNVATEIVRLKEEDGFGELYKSYGGNPHECSHGEAFIKVVQNRFFDHGLYILDEPEAALSPSRQMALLCLIDGLVKQGSQFIIATHSPILISYDKGEILDLNNNFAKISYKDTDIYQLYKLFLDNPEAMQDKLYNNDDLTN